MAHQTPSGLPQFSPPPPKKNMQTTTAEESRQELRQAIQSSSQVLFSASTVLALFPDTVSVDRAKVTVAKRYFYRAADVTSMRIEDVLNATCTVGPIFGNLIIISQVMNTEQMSTRAITSEKTLTIGRFWRDDATRLKRIIQGYVIALRRKVDCNSLETGELAMMLERLGADDYLGQ